VPGFRSLIPRPEQTSRVGPLRSWGRAFRAPRRWRADARTLLLVRCRSGGTYSEICMNSLARAFPHAVNMHRERERERERGCAMCTHTRPPNARTRACSQTRGSPPFRTPSWMLGMARMCSSRRGRKRKRDEGRERGIERGGGSTGRKESTSPEERDAKQVTLASFQDSAWLGYLHLPKFTGGQCLAHFYGRIVGVLTLCCAVSCFAPGFSFSLSLFFVFFCFFFFFFFCSTNFPAPLKVCKG